MNKDFDQSLKFNIITLQLYFQKVALFIDFQEKICIRLYFSKMGTAIFFIPPYTSYNMILIIFP